MTATYGKHGIQFLYPANWTLQENVTGQMPFGITLESPSGGLWILSVFAAGTDKDMLIRDTATTLETQYDCLELTRFEDAIEDYSVEGFDAFFYCLDLLVSAQIRVIATNEFTFVVLAQAENREYDKLVEVFNAVTVSLLKPDLSTA
ncbi:hypothetical protein N9242_01165 [Vicingaceae bacterium]|nr:hypothetical protein [Vicingaceae bacterium]